MQKPRLPAHLNELVGDLLFAVTTGGGYMRKPAVSLIDREIMRHDIEACKAELDAYIAQYERLDARPLQPATNIIPFPLSGPSRSMTQV